MNTLLLRTLELKKSPSVQTFAQYREAESQNCRHTSVTSEGELLEHQTLELRVHPPNVTVDNESYDDRTIITVDSANRPGTLVEVVQCLTELGLIVKRARISSDGGWFVDEFHVCEQQGRKVTSESKLKVIKAVLNVEYEPDGDHDSSQHGPGSSSLQRAHGESFDEGWQHSTVFEMAGQDRSGLLADVLALLTHNGCDVRSAAVWTYSGRVAFVLSVVVEGCGQPIRDNSKLTRLKQLLHGMMDRDGNGIVNAQPVKGLIHYERRLHQLMLKEEEKEWLRNKDAILTKAGSERLLISPKFSRPDVTIQHYSHLNYWLVTIRCKDRNKLFFDTVCTLSDLNYDVYHGAIDSEGHMAVQLYYIRPRFGDFFWDSVKATKLRVMLEAAIQRRFPKGLKVHVFPPATGCHLGQNWLADLTAAWKEAGLWITRAKVRAYTDHGHTLYVMDANGQPPDHRKVNAACQAIGGAMHGPAEGLPLGVSPPRLAGVINSNVAPAGNAAAGKVTGEVGAAGGAASALQGQGAKFFYMLQQRVWDGSPSSFASI
eukprot:gene5371-5606_t